ncbi:MAG: type III PLP-dependent enzyme, partial [Paracoccaceae bacterium]
IGRVSDAVFGETGPALLCDPGRALVADAMSLATRVKALRDDNHVFLNDGIYGGLSEHLVVGHVDRIDVLSTRGRLRGASPKRARTVFGPTCDSLDRLPGMLDLPEALTEGDYVIFHGMGAYSSALATRFNGYGALALETVSSLSVI